MEATAHARRSPFHGRGVAHEGLLSVVARGAQEEEGPVGDDFQPLGEAGEEEQREAERRAEAEAWAKADLALAALDEPLVRPPPAPTLEQPAERSESPVSVPATTPASSDAFPAAQVGVRDSYGTERTIPTEIDASESKTSLGPPPPGPALVIPTPATQETRGVQWDAGETVCTE